MEREKKRESGEKILKEMGRKMRGESERGRDSE